MNLTGVPSASSSIVRQWRTSRTADTETRSCLAVGHHFTFSKNPIVPTPLTGNPDVAPARHIAEVVSTKLFSLSLLRTTNRLAPESISINSSVSQTDAISSKTTFTSPSSSSVTFAQFNRFFFLAAPPCVSSDGFPFLFRGQLACLWPFLRHL